MFVCKTVRESDWQVTSQTCAEVTRLCHVTVNMNKPRLVLVLSSGFAEKEKTKKNSSGTSRFKMDNIVVGGW